MPEKPPIVHTVKVMVLLAHRLAVDVLRRARDLQSFLARRPPSSTTVLPRAITLSTLGLPSTRAGAATSTRWPEGGEATRSSLPKKQWESSSFAVAHVPSFRFMHYSFPSHLAPFAVLPSPRGRQADLPHCHQGPASCRHEWQMICHGSCFDGLHRNDRWFALPQRINTLSRDANEAVRND